MGNKTTIRALTRAAYEQGWRDACDDFMQQASDPQHPIGRRKKGDYADVLVVLDPKNLLGLRDGGATS